MMSSAASARVQEPKTEFTNIDNMMAAARAQYASQQHLHQRVEPRTYVPSPEDTDFNGRVDISISKARGMIAEAKSQLDAPHTAPEQLTVEELDDQAEWRKWDDGLRTATECNDRWLADNQTLFDEVMDSIPEPHDDWDLLLDDVGVPDAPLLLRGVQALERISAAAKCWVAISKARSREHVVRDAALKPVLVVKPAKGEMEPMRRDEGSVARLVARSIMPRDVRKIRRPRNKAPSKSQKPGDDATAKPSASRVSSTKSDWHTLASWDYQCTWQ